MSLTLTARNYKTGRQETKVIGQATATIGRSADESTWPLPDPDRRVSKQHCQIEYRDGGYFITDTSANGVFINGQLLGRGRQARLNDGDTVVLCTNPPMYEIQVTMEAVRPVPERPSPRPAEAVEAARKAVSPARPEDDWWEPEAAGRAVDEKLKAAEQVPPPVVPSGSVQEVAVLQAAVSPARSEDAWWWQEAAERVEPPPGVPPRPAGKVEGAGIEAARPAKLEDDWWWQEAAGRVELSPVVPLPVEEVAAVREAVSPDRLEADWRQEITGRAELPPAGESPPLTGSHDLEPGVPPEPARIQAEETTPPLPAAPPAGAALQALLQGAKLPALPLGEADIPGLLNNLGQIFHQTVKGLSELLKARRIIKTEFRVPQYTMIGSAKINPFKSMETDKAMELLLTNSDPACLPSLQALQEVFVDLQAHELALMAGIRAALTHLLRRFDPQNLELHISKHSLLDNILPSNRKAKYWDEFIRLYTEIAREAEEDFQKLFEGEFERAYEQQVRQLHSRSGDSS